MRAGGFMVNHDSCIPISDDALHFLTIAQQGNNPLANQCNTHVREDITDLDNEHSAAASPAPPTATPTQQTAAV